MPQWSRVASPPVWQLRSGSLSRSVREETRTVRAWHLPADIRSIIADGQAQSNNYDSDRGKQKACIAALKANLKARPDAGA